MSAKKRDLNKMFPPITKEHLLKEVEEIKNNASLSIDEKIRHLESLKVDVLISSAPVKFFREFKKMAIKQP